MISDAERKFAIKQLDQSRKRLLRVIEGLSPEQLLYRPDPGRWSIAENVEHVIVVERRMLGAIEKLVHEPPDLAKQCCMSDAELVWRISTVTEPAQAPERALPTLRWPAQSLRQEFETTRQQTRDFIQAADGDFRTHFLPHPLFGDFDGYQWLLAIGAHCNRHCAQSETVKLSHSFPA